MLTSPPLVVDVIPHDHVPGDFEKQVNRRVDDALASGLVKQLQDKYLEIDLGMHFGDARPGGSSGPIAAKSGGTVVSAAIHLV